jgi:hypothetical protein
MTGYQSKKAAAQDKLEQWGCEAFNDWWDSDYDNSTNPYEINTFAYWAWAGWQAALAQPAQEPVCPECKAEVLYECVACSSNNYPAQPAQERVEWVDLQKEAQQIVESKFLWKKFIDGTPLANDIACWMTDFALQHTPPQRPWVGLTEGEWFNWWRASPVADETEAEIDFADFLIIAQAVMTKLKEDNK